MSPRQLADCWTRYRRHHRDRDRDRLCTHYWPWLVSDCQIIRAKLLGRHRETLPLDDLISAGAGGMLDAIRRFDPSRSQFSTYAHRRVEGAIKDWFRKIDPFGRQARTFWNRRNAIRDLLRDETGDPPDDEVCRIMRLPRRSYDSRLRRARQGDHSSNASDHAPGLAAVRAAVADPTEECAAADLWQRMRLCLTGRQRAVMDMVVAGHNLGPIAAAVGLSESRISQIRSDARMRLSIWLAIERARCDREHRRTA